MEETPGEKWKQKHNISKSSIYKYFEGKWGENIKSIFDIQVLLACGQEFTVGFQGAGYFISPDYSFTILSPDCERVLYETDDLDDFGENARIGENGEFYLKDVIDELEF